MISYVHEQQIFLTSFYNVPMDRHRLEFYYDVGHVAPMMFLYLMLPGGAKLKRSEGVPGAKRAQLEKRTERRQKKDKKNSQLTAIIPTRLTTTTRQTTNQQEKKSTRKKSTTKIKSTRNNQSSFAALTCSKRTIQFITLFKYTGVTTIM